MCQELRKLVAQAQTLMEGINTEHEKKFVDDMKKHSSKLAGMQTKIENLHKDIDKQLAADGQRLDSDLAWDSQIMVGVIVFMVGAYAAVSLYRSPFCGKQGDAGAKNVAGLKKVLTELGKNPGSV